MVSIFPSLVLFFIGFYILVKGAGILVNGSTSIAKIFNISAWFIGVVIVGFGTSLPEFSVSIASALNGNNIGLGTIIGTNIFNVLVILGLSAIFIPIHFKKYWVVSDLVIHIGAVLATTVVITLPLFAFLGDRILFGITRVEGVFLLVLLFVWIWALFRRKVSTEEKLDYKAFTVLTSITMVIAGTAGVFIGGQWVVGGAKTIAEIFNVSPELIGLTVVAMGTSLPELTVSVVALFKRTSAIAVGNVIGSSVINFLGIVGITAVVQPISTLATIHFDIFVMLGVACLLFVFTFFDKRYVLSRGEGFLFIVVYVSYLVFIVMRG